MTNNIQHFDDMMRANANAAYGDMVRPTFDHSVAPTDTGQHPEWLHLYLFEVEPHCGSYILTCPGQLGDTLIGPDDAEYMFGEQLDDGFAYLSDEYLQLLESE